MKQPAREINTSNRDVTAMDRVLEANPPQITWRKNNHGVMVAVEVIDHPAKPKGLTPEQRRRKSEMERQRRQRARMEDEAREVADRFTRYRADNTPLLTAARRGI